MKYSAPAECEIIHSVNCEISHFVRCEMKFAHIREANISHAAGVFHISKKYFTCPIGQISLKKAKSFDLVCFDLISEIFGDAECEIIHLVNCEILLLRRNVK